MQLQSQYPFLPPKLNFIKLVTSSFSLLPYWLWCLYWVSKNYRLLGIDYYCKAYTFKQGGAAVGHFQRHNAPRAIAAGTALASLLATCIGIALNIYSYWTTLAMAQSAVQGLSYRWGPTLGTLAAAGFCLIIALVAYIASCFSRRERTRDSFPLYDYEFGHDNRHYY